MGYTMLCGYTKTILFERSDRVRCKSLTICMNDTSECSKRTRQVWWTPPPVLHMTWARAFYTPDTRDLVNEKLQQNLREELL